MTATALLYDRIRLVDGPLAGTTSTVGSTPCGSIDVTVEDEGVNLTARYAKVLAEDGEPSRDDAGHLLFEVIES